MSYLFYFILGSEIPWTRNESDAGGGVRGRFVARGVTGVGGEATGVCVGEREAKVELEWSGLNKRSGLCMEAQ